MRTVHLTINSQFSVQTFLPFIKKLQDDNSNINPVTFLENKDYTLNSQGF